jgi:hypothetical protein
MAANKNDNGEKGRLKENPLVSALVSDPNAGPPNTVVLHGYVGKSTTPNTWRLYLDATLASYVEISEDDVLHHKEIADDGGTIVWVPKSTELKVTSVSSTTIQAEFLSGAIAAGRMRPTGRPNVGALAAVVRSVACPSIFTNCTSRILPCPSDGCPTWEGCPPPPTVIDWCRPSEFAPLCRF